MSVFNAMPQGWKEIHEIVLPAREGRVVPNDELGVGPATRRLLQSRFANGVYVHQARAIGAYLAGADVCLITGTASGKTLAFMVAGIEALADQNARVLAVYPQKALGNEQEVRWRRALEDAGLPDASVGRIDGSVSMSDRDRTIRNDRVVICTPDVLHAWLLSRLDDQAVRSFIRALSLVVLDEIHTYTGVLGSNAAYLFRRIQHAAACGGRRPRFFAASATMVAPARHLESLVGRSFEVIGPEEDSSPRYEVRLKLVVPPRVNDVLSEVADLLKSLAEDPAQRTVAFVDSRKQTEHIASIGIRKLAADDGEEAGAEPDHGNPLETADLLPYRAGYESVDRKRIEDRLRQGSLRAVVSTSALELGIDLDFSTGVLIGVPRSATSLRQRIGRIGRRQPGTVYVVNAGDLIDEVVFRKPDRLLTRPLAEGALYLENRRIQYIHALCLARAGGEHDAMSKEPLEAVIANGDVRWPEGFASICELERTGQLDPELQGIKAEAGDSPNYAFPLRDVENQFRVLHKSGSIQEALGQVSYRQALRETYPGAVYYYATKPYRVTAVSMHAREVTVRRERRYTTKPAVIPTLIYPNLKPGNIYAGSGYDDLIVVECALGVHESVTGFRERRGGGETAYKYPLNGTPSGIYYRSKVFARHYFTSGVLLLHPVLNEADVDVDVLAEHVFEALLMVAPFERADLGFAVDRLRTPAGNVPVGARFICVFDQTYGSLRLSGRLAEAGSLTRVLDQAVELVRVSESHVFSEMTKRAIGILATRSSLSGTPLETRRDGAELTTLPTMLAVVMPDSQGIDVLNGNQLFNVERVFMHPEMGLAYRGRHDGLTTPAAQKENIPHSALRPIPGVSRVGHYDPETGDVIEGDWS